MGVMDQQPLSAFHQFLGKVENAILYPLMELIALAAFVVFVWGIVEFIRGAANEEARKTGQQHILWGLIGLVIIFAARAIIAIAAHTVGITPPTN